MTVEQKVRLSRLHQRAEQHANEYKRLLQDRGTQPKALKHLRKAEQLYSHVRDLIMDWRRWGGRSASRVAQPAYPPGSAGGPSRGAAASSAAQPPPNLTYCKP